MIDLVTGGFYFFCASAIYFYGRIHCNVIESTKIMIVMRLRGFFNFHFFINLILIQSNSFQSTLRSYTKSDNEKYSNSFVFFIKYDDFALYNSTY